MLAASPPYSQIASVRLGAPVPEHPGVCHDRMRSYQRRSCRGLLRLLSVSRPVGQNILNNIIDAIAFQYLVSLPGRHIVETRIIIGIPADTDMRVY